MVPKTKTMEDWRDFFRRANTDIFDVIHNAIFIAASDCPGEFQSRRDGLTEKLFTTRSILTVPVADGEGRDGSRGCESCSEKSFKESNNSIITVDEVGELSHKSSCTCDEIVVRDVMRIRQVLKQKDDQTEAELFDCLRRVGLMKISVEILKVTEIGRAVSDLRKHNSKRIRHLVRTLITCWRGVVDEWVSATTATTEMTPETVNPSVLNERIVPATQTAPTFEHTKSYNGIVEDNKTKKQQPLCQVSIAEEKSQTKKILKPLSTASGLGKCRSEPMGTQKKTSTCSQEKSKDLDEEFKLESAKRKLHASYQRVENGGFLLFSIRTCINCY
ncbi:putative mediator of RNA polymerase II transcription subunit 26b [Acorus gramineus]|uniref:Mediator of RNA polymerase II transcription subunit 26b n=1 Tax=Acorus gramineus TaxID=55184 RepID=A0AAV9AD56_ACOGR|nr:putative mediator of RNA polymerase II transcription subunit 26b [Acorus gramineus]